MERNKLKGKLSKLLFLLYLCGLPFYGTTQSFVEIALDTTFQQPYALHVVDSLAYVVFKDNHSRLAIYNVSDSNNIVFRGALNMSYPRDVFVSGNYAYVGDNYNGIRVVDISNPAIPTIVQTLAIPQDQVYGVKVVDTFLFASHGHGVGGPTRFITYSISDPLNPVLLDSINEPLKRAQGFIMDSNYAYIHYRQSGLHIIDINNPSSLTLLGNSASPSGQFAIAYDLFTPAKKGNIIYLPRHSNGLEVIDVTNKSNPTIVNTINSLTFSAVGYGPDTACLITATSGEKFRVYNIEADPSNPVFTGEYTYGTMCPSTSVRDMEIHGNLLYATRRSGAIKDTTCNRFSIIRIDDIGCPLLDARFKVDTLCLGKSTYFTDLSIPSDSVVSWHWSFGDGDTSILQHPVHLYADTGSYTITLIVSSPSKKDTSIQTIEISECNPCGGNYTFIVTNNNDAGAGSLRDAINKANAQPGMDSIGFAIPSGSVGDRTIKVDSALPEITDPLVIDGTSQCLGNPFGVSDAKIFLTTDSTFSFNGISNRATTLMVYGMYIKGFSSGVGYGSPIGGSLIVGDTNKGNVIAGNSGYGIYSKAFLLEVKGNFIGIDTNGTTAAGNGLTGVTQDQTAGTVTIGGPSMGERNIISGNTAEGIWLRRGTIKVQGNFIGTDYTGTVAVPNIGRGVRIESDAGNTLIGGPNPGEGNVISGNTSNGIQVIGNERVIQGNYIGTDITGTIPIGNSYGIDFFFFGNDNLFGGINPGEGNVFAFNRQEGIHITNSNNLRNRILGNSFYCNSQNAGTGGIKLGTGGNNNKPSPNITAATFGGITGTSAMGDTIELFGDDSCTYCEGQYFIGFVVADSLGNWNYSGTISHARITATATDTAGNTSAFATCMTVTGTPPLIANFLSDTVCLGDSTSFTDLSTPSDSIVYWLWTFGNGDSSLQQHPKHLYNSPGNYNVELVIRSATDTDTTTINVVVDGCVFLIANFNRDTVCVGDSIQFTDLSSPSDSVTSWDWDFGDGNASTNQHPKHFYATSDTFTVTLIVSSSTIGSDTVTESVIVFPKPMPQLSNDTILCDTSHLVLHSNTGINNVDYLWNTGATIDSINVLILSDTVFYVDASNTGCICRDSIHIDLVQSDGLEIIGTTNLCIGNAENYQVNEGQNILWSTGETTTTISRTMIASQSLTVMDSGSCGIRSDSIWINVHPLPSADAGNDTTIAHGECLALNPSGGITYQWSPETGLSCTDCASPELCITQNVAYIVMVIDSNGCTASDTIRISVDDGCAHFVPNAFSPNGDGMNDVLHLRTKGIETFKLRVYNRWGTLIWETEDRNKGWDGFSTNGKAYEKSVYTWQLSGTCFNGRLFKDQGNITLIK